MNPARPVLILDVAVGDTIAAGDVRFTLRDKSGRRAKLAIEAPRDVAITRVPTTDTRIKSVDTIQAEAAEALQAFEEQTAERLNAPLEHRVETGWPNVPSRLYAEDDAKGKRPK